MKPPCKQEGIDCPDRCPGCQGKCPKYAAFKAAKEEANARRRAECEATDTISTSKLRMVKVINQRKRR